MVSGIAADALGARRIGDIAFEVATRTGVESVMVDDDDSVRARRLLWNEYRTVVDYGATTAVAALTSGLVCRASLRGNALAADVGLHARKAHELDDKDLETLFDGFRTSVIPPRSGRLTVRV
jgi:threonine dehydratase